MFYLHCSWFSYRCMWKLQELSRDMPSRRLHWCIVYHWAIHDVLGYNYGCWVPRKLPSRVHEELRSKGLTPQKDYGKIETNVAVIVKCCSGLRMKKRRDGKMETRAAVIVKSYSGLHIKKKTRACAFVCGFHTYSRVHSNGNQYHHTNFLHYHQ